jgi:hypothetical protein
MVMVTEMGTRMCWTTFRYKGHGHGDGNQDVLDHLQVPIKVMVMVTEMGTRMC